MSEQKEHCRTVQNKYTVSMSDDSGLIVVLPSLVVGLFIHFPSLKSCHSGSKKNGFKLPSFLFPKGIYNSEKDSNLE